jgi:uncharacterized protein DUF4124
MMHSGFLRAGWVVLMAGVFGSPVAQAEIYTWIDASGVTNVSNLQPPDGVKVSKAEADAAAARIRDLENLLAHSPPPDYRPPAAQPVIQYIVEPQPAPMQLTVETGAPAYGAYDYGCNPSWAGCALSWWPVVVVGAPVFRPSHPIHGRPPMPSPHMPPFGPKLTNVVSPTTGFVPPLTTVVPPVTSFMPSLTNVVAPIPQTFAVPRTFNSSPPGLKRG